MQKSRFTEAITYIKASDLQKIADQLYIDGMEYARIAIRYDDNSDSLDGSVHIAGVKSYESDKPEKYYDFISPADLPHCYL